MPQASQEVLAQAQAQAQVSQAQQPQTQPQVQAQQQVSLVQSELRLDTQALQAWNSWLETMFPHMRAHQQQLAQELESSMLVPGQVRIPGATYGVDLSRGMTVFLMGPLGSWKTCWCAQWPRPFFISIAAEGGDDALPFYPKVAMQILARAQTNKDPLAVPPVFNILRPPSREVSKIAEFEQWVDKVCRNFKAWGICTVVIDSVTYLIDMWINEHTEARRKNSVWQSNQRSGKVEMMRPGDWGMLDAFIKSARVKLANAGVNVIWTALTKDRYEQDTDNQMNRKLKEVSPRIQGAQKDTLPGSCKIIIQAVKHAVPSMSMPGRTEVRPVYHVAPSDEAVDVRHKYADMFPRGQLWDDYLYDEPTFRSVWRELAPFIYMGQ